MSKDLSLSVAVSSLADYLELTKPRVTSMVLLTTAAGFYLGSPRGNFDLMALFHVLVGTALLASGTAALNQFMEREADGRMRRTMNRPLPAGRVESSDAMLLGMVLISTGTLYLLLTTNLVTTLLGWLTSTVYLLLYTPMKPRSSVCTLIGAVPGAIPPVMGWTAAGAPLGLEAFLLFGILFSWQFPHFLSIAWLYRDDYARGGFQMLPRGGSRTAVAFRILSFAGLLFLLSLLPFFGRLAGWIYLVGALILGLMFLHSSIRMSVNPSTLTSRTLLRTSVLYLPILLLLMTLDKV